MIVTNKEDKKKSASKELMHFSSNVSVDLIRNDSMEDRDYTVVPMIMIVEGVLNGSQGPILYPEEELSKLPGTWNHKPVVVYHPEINGQGVSACSPEICDTYKIGVIMNTVYEDGKLKAEAWIEKSRAEKVDNRVLEAIENQQMMELSTGLFIEVENEEGEFGGKKYSGIARNYHPDHLAVLPDIKGACSLEDGAGFIRNQLKDAGIDMDAEKLKLLVNHITRVYQENELSHSDIRDKIYSEMKNTSLVTTEDWDFWIVEVYETYFIYEMDGKYFYHEYKVEDDEVSLIGSPYSVNRIITYKTEDGRLVGNTDSQNTNNQMNKKSLIDKLIANGGFEEGDREFLDGKTEEQLKKMVGNQKADTENPDPAAKQEEKEVPAANSKKEEKPVTLEGYVSAAPAEVREVLNSSIAMHKRAKERHIEAITKNARNVFTEEQLRSKSLEELQSIAALAANTSEKAPADYSLNGGTPETTEVPTINEEPMVAPDLFGD